MEIYIQITVSNQMIFFSVGTHVFYSHLTLHLIWFSLRPAQITICTLIKRRTGYPNCFNCRTAREDLCPNLFADWLNCLFKKGQRLVFYKE